MKPERKKLAVSIVLALLLLGAATLVVFAPVGRSEFVEMDDGKYVFENPFVLKGISQDGALWAFRTFHAANWHPLTWLSHMLDVQLFDLRAGGHHLTSLLLHLANALLLCLVLQGLTGAIWRSLIVAALFALHPLHVESVAWIAERKDVLSTLFGLLALAAYRRYVACPGAGRYLPVFALFALGLMAKPMLVTLPAILLLLDWWPLGRFSPGAAAVRPGTVSLTRIAAEKAPLLALSAAAGLITLRAQQQWGTLESAQNFPPLPRLANAAVAYVLYVKKFFLPGDLAVFYPRPAAGPGLPEAAGAAVLLALITFAVGRGARRRPALMTGWLWFAMALVPVIGLVQVGSQALADRYTYLPYVGLGIALVWGAGDAIPAGRWRRPAAAAAAIAILAGAVMARAQVRRWHDSIALFGHVAAVTTDNWMAHFSLGNAYLRRGLREEAALHYGEAVRIRPSFAQAYGNLGKICYDQGNMPVAIAYLNKALALAPGLLDAQINLGAALHRSGRLEEAVAHYDAALAGDPDDPITHYNLGLALEALRRPAEAAVHFRRAAQLQRDFPAARASLERVLKSRAAP